MKNLNRIFMGLFIAGGLLLGSAFAAAAQSNPGGGDLRIVSINNAHTAKARPKGFYHPYVYRGIGTAVKTLPSRAYQFSWGPYRYYYHEGIFYQAYANGSYKIAAPPVGAEVPSLPFGSDIITIDGYPYYQYKGIYYDLTFLGNGEFAYKVVGMNGVYHKKALSNYGLPLIGDMIDTLPAGCHTVKLYGRTYWVTPDQIYLEKVDAENRARYRVVAFPDADGLPSA